MKQPKCPGFTLVEILIVLTLFSLILVLVFSALHTSSLSWQASERQIEVNEDQRLVITFIKRQVAHTIPLLQLNKRNSNLLFKGEEDSLQFVSTLPAHRGGGGLYLLTLLADKDITLYYQKISDDITLSLEMDDEQIKSQVLISNIKAIEFRYYGREKTKDSPDWHEQWIEQKNLPDLISLRIISKSSADSWPEILVPVRNQFYGGQPQFTLHNKKDSSPI